MFHQYLWHFDVWGATWGKDVNNTKALSQICSARRVTSLELKSSEMDCKFSEFQARSVFQILEKCGDAGEVKRNWMKVPEVTHFISNFLNIEYGLLSPSLLEADIAWLYFIIICLESYASASFGVYIFVRACELHLDFYWRLDFGPKVCAIHFPCHRYTT